MEYLLCPLPLLLYILSIEINTWPQGMNIMLEDRYDLGRKVIPVIRKDMKSVTSLAICTQDWGDDLDEISLHSVGWDQFREVSWTLDRRGWTVCNSQLDALHFFFLCTWVYCPWFGHSIVDSVHFSLDTMASANKNWKKIELQHVLIQG
jgi:hypothetical protein